MRIGRMDRNRAVGVREIVVISLVTLLDCSWWGIERDVSAIRQFSYRQSRPVAEIGAIRCPIAVTRPEFVKRPWWNPVVSAVRRMSVGSTIRRLAAVGGV